jgi:hypothetical protein
MDELLEIARAQSCTFPSNFEETTIQTMLQTQAPSTMYQDFTARRPMEVETYLGSPVQLAKAANVKVPRLETLYTLLRHVNKVNKERPVAPPAASAVSIHCSTTPSNDLPLQSATAPTDQRLTQWTPSVTAAARARHGSTWQTRSAACQWISWSSQ